MTALGGHNEAALIESCRLRADDRDVEKLTVIPGASGRSTHAPSNRSSFYRIRGEKVQRNMADQSRGGNH